MINYINIGTTYQNYLEKGSAITLFDDSINHFALSDSILSDSIQVEIFKRKSLFAFSAKIGMKSICLKYNKHLNEIKISLGIAYSVAEPCTATKGFSVY